LKTEAGLNYRTLRSYDEISYENTAMFYDNSGETYSFNSASCQNNGNGCLKISCILPGVPVPGDALSTRIFANTSGQSQNYTASCNFSDFSGNMVTCSYIENVFDLEDPIIHGCPSVVVALLEIPYTFHSAPFAFFSNLTASDNVNAFLNDKIQCNFNSSLFPVGLTPVSCNVSDLSNNVGYCIFNVSVLSQTPANVTCPTNGTLYALGRFVRYELNTSASNIYAITNTTLSDTSKIRSNDYTSKSTYTSLFESTKAIYLSNCSSGTNLFICNNASVSLEVGYHLFKYSAVDINKVVGTCFWGVEVIDVSAPRIIAGCNSTETDMFTIFTAAARGTEFAIVNWPGFVINSTKPLLYGPSFVTYESTPKQQFQTNLLDYGNNSAFAYSAPVNITATVSDEFNNKTYCKFTVVVLKTPVITGCGTFTRTTIPGTPVAFIPLTNVTLQRHDHVRSLTGLDAYTAFCGKNASIGIYNFTFVATDVLNATSNCSISIVVKDDEKPIILNPNGDFTFRVDDDANDTVVVFNNFTASDNSGIVVTHYDPPINPSGQRLLVGLYTYAFVATDASGNKETYKFNITVMDTQPPKMYNCLSNSTYEATVNISTLINGSQGLASWPAINFTDNVGVVKFGYTSNVVPSSSFSGLFNIGITAVEFFVTDAAGLTSHCNFFVKVWDVENPSVQNCPVNPIRRNSTIGKSFASINIEQVLALVATDNSARPLNLTKRNINVFNEYFIGNNIVDFIFTDMSNNSVNCRVRILVSDFEAPIFKNCLNTSATNPLLFSVVGEALAAHLVVNTFVPFADDNSMYESSNGNNPFNITVPRIVTNSSLELGVLLLSGLSNLSYFVFDASNNSAECIVYVTLQVIQASASIASPVSIIAGVVGGLAFVIFVIFYFVKTKMRWASLTETQALSEIKDLKKIIVNTERRSMATFFPGDNVLYDMTSWKEGGIAETSFKATDSSNYHDKIDETMAGLDFDDDPKSKYLEVKDQGLKGSHYLGSGYEGLPNFGIASTENHLSGRKSNKGFEGYRDVSDWKGTPSTSGYLFVHTNMVGEDKEKEDKEAAAVYDAVDSDVINPAKVKYTAGSTAEYDNGAYLQVKYTAGSTAEYDNGAYLTTSPSISSAVYDNGASLSTSPSIRSAVYDNSDVINPAEVNYTAGSTAEYDNGASLSTSPSIRSVYDHPQFSLKENTTIKIGNESQITPIISDTSMYDNSFYNGSDLNYQLPNDIHPASHMPEYVYEDE